MTSAATYTHTTLTDGSRDQGSAGAQPHAHAHTHQPLTHGPAASQRASACVLLDVHLKGRIDENQYSLSLLFYCLSGLRRNVQMLQMCWRDTEVHID